MTDEEKKLLESERNRKYHEEHREEILARKRKAYQENKGKPKKVHTPEQQEARRRYQREWKRNNRSTPEGKARQTELDRRYISNNKEKVTERRKQLHALNKEKRNAACRRYYQENSEELKRKKREYCKANREKVRLAEKAIEHKRRSVKGKLTATEIGSLIEESFGVCAYCGKDSSATPSHIEHCTPLSRGGTNSIDNVVISCETCNKKKHHKTPLEFLCGWPKVTERFDFFVDQ